MKKLAQPIGLSAIDARTGRIRITNKQDFTTLGWLRGSWELTVNGGAMKAGKLRALHTPPGATEDIQIAFKPPRVLRGDECMLTIRFVAKNATNWCEAGHEVAFGQFAVPVATQTPKAKARPRIHGAMHRLETSKAVTVRTERLEAVISKTIGTLTSLRWDGREMLASGPRLNVWRAPTDNDGIKRWSGQQQKPLGRWLSAGLNDLKRTVKSFTLGVEKKRRFAVEIVHRITAKGGNFEHREVLSILPDGEIEFQHTVVADTSLPDLPRVGMEFTLPPAMSHLKWYGNGPHESYADRKRSTLVGLYESHVAAQYVPYIMPQSHGNKTDVRWFHLSDVEGNGLKFSGDRWFHFTASHYTADDLFRALHTIELAPRPEVFVTMDALQRGLGTSSCGPDTLPKYRIPPGKYSFTFRWKPIGGQTT